MHFSPLHRKMQSNSHLAAPPFLQLAKGPLRSNAQISEEPTIPATGYFFLTPT
jgi:hypothetical protein